MEFEYYDKTNVYDVILDLFFYISLFIIFIFLILEVSINKIDIGLTIFQLNEIYFYLSFFILVIFILDLIRLYKQSGDFISFLKTSWIDIIATIPFGLVLGQPMFEFLKILRATKLTRFSKISKLLKETKTISKVKDFSNEYNKRI